MALGEIKLSYNDFYALTPRSFTNVISGFRNSQYEEQKVNWEQTRYLFYATLKPYLKGNPKIKELMPLPWDEEIDEEQDSEEVITAEQSEELLKKEQNFWKKIDEKKILKQKEDGEFSTD